MPAAIVQATIPADGAGLGEYWLTDGSTRSDAIGLACYRSLVCWGLGIGLPIAAVGVAIQPIADFSPDIAILGEAPNTRCATYWTMQPIR